MSKIVIPQIEIKLSYKNKTKQSDFFQVSTPDDIHKLIRACFDADTLLWREEMILLCLNRANKVIGFFRVSVGGLASTLCDPKVVFTIALNCGAHSIILAHNHPSGNLQPSKADLDLSKRIKQAGSLLDIVLLDNLILTDTAYLSFSNEGLL